MNKLKEVMKRALSHKTDNGENAYRLKDVAELANETAQRVDEIVKYLNKKKQKKIKEKKLKRIVYPRADMIDKIRHEIADKYCIPYDVLWPSCYMENNKGGLDADVSQK